MTVDRVKCSLDRARWRHPVALSALEAQRPYRIFTLRDSSSGLYSLAGLLLSEAGVSDDLLETAWSPQGLANYPTSLDLPSHLTWMVDYERGSSRWRNSDIEQTLHKWSDEGLMPRRRQWERLDLAEGAISGTLSALGIDVQWVGSRNVATARAHSTEAAA
jgi:hypothetical protein